MDIQDILGYALIAVGVSDVVLVPIFVERAWKSAGRPPEQKRVLLNVLRAAGWITIVAGVLIKLGVVKLAG